MNCPVLRCEPAEHVFSIWVAVFSVWVAGIAYQFYKKWDLVVCTCPPLTEHDAAQHYNSNIWKFSTVDILNEGTPIYSPALLASATKQNVRGKQLWKVDFKCSHVSGKVEFKCCHTSETLLTSSLPYIQKGYSKGYHWQNSQPISDPDTLWTWRRSRGGDALWETDMLCWELTILPSHHSRTVLGFPNIQNIWLRSQSWRSLAQFFLAFHTISQFNTLSVYILAFHTISQFNFLFTENCACLK